MKCGIDESALWRMCRRKAADTAPAALQEGSDIVVDPQRIRELTATYFERLGTAQEENLVMPEVQIWPTTLEERQRA